MVFMKKNFVYALCLFSCLLVFFHLNAQNASCPAPLNPVTSSIGMNSALLSWTDSSNAALFHIQWRPVTNPPVNYNQANSQVPFYHLSGLQCHTHYEWRVQAICASSNGMSMVSPFTNLVTFTTLPCSGTSCPAPTGLHATNITASSAELSWLSTNLSSVYNLRYRSMLTASWTTIHNVTPPYTLGNLQCHTTYEWQVQSVCSTPVGNISSWSASHFFTTLACPVLCPAPGGLSVSNITSNSATLSWNAVAGAVGYQVRYRPSNTVNWTYATSITNMVTITGLHCHTTYVWQVRTICTPTTSNAATSAFSSHHTFTTLACPSLCQVPAGLNASNITSTSAVLSWNATNATAYHVRYRKAGNIGTTPGSGWTMLYTTNTSVTITGLHPGSVYEWQVQSVCMGSTNNTIVLSGWSALHTFSTPLLLTAVPNPAHDYAEICYFAAEGASVTIEVRDILGNLLSRNEHEAENNTNSLRLNTASWKEGIYYIKLISSSGTQTLRLIVKH
jgi:hypothetical protein